MSDGCQVTKGIFWAKRMTCCPVPEPSSKANSCRWDCSSSTSSSTAHRSSQFLSAWGDSSMVWRRWEEGRVNPSSCYYSPNIDFFLSEEPSYLHWCRFSSILVEAGSGGWPWQQMGAEITWLRGFPLCSSHSVQNWWSTGVETDSCNMSEC